MYKAIQATTRSNFLKEYIQKLEDENHLLKTDNISFIQKIAELKSQIAQLNQILNSSELSRQEAFTSAKSAMLELGNTLSKQLIEVAKRETQEARELSEKNIALASSKFQAEFERIVNVVGALSKDVQNSNDTADVIRRSLLSPTGAGKLAEITLENILKASGLRQGLDFIMQYNISGNENTLRPDALIFLPSGNLMVIDAKASKFLMDNVEDNFALAKTMNAHLKSLSSKDYATRTLETLQKTEQQFYHVFTLMFLPSEHAVEKVTQIDPDFMQKAWQANILPVGPTGLMNMLSFAKFQISDHMRSENHQMILDEVKKLLSSIGTISDFAQKLGNNIQHLVTNYDRFAGSFNKTFLSKAKKIQKLGIDIGNKDINTPLERYTVVSAKSELIEVEAVHTNKIEE